MEIVNRNRTRNKMDVIVIPVYNRPEYLERTLSSVFENLNGESIIISDDGSTDPKVEKIINKYFERAKGFDIDMQWFTFENAGIAQNLKRVLDKCKNYDTIITLDSDFIVKKDWVKKLKELVGKDVIVTGFNAPKHPIIKSGKFHVKKTIGGGNLCFTYETYLKFIRPYLKDGQWDWNMSYNAPRLLCTNPSVCQHIGVQSVMGHVNADVAKDF